MSAVDLHEVAHAAYHEHNETCACREVGHLTAFIADKVAAALVRCTCPVGFGQVADPDCPKHGATAKHTITGPPEVLASGSAASNEVEEPEAVRPGSYPVDASRIAERLAAARDRDPGTPAAWRDHDEAWRDGWRHGLSEARAIVAWLATEKQRGESETFAQWLGRHCLAAGVQVPRAGTPRRRLLARVYAAFEEAGYTIAVEARGLERGEPERAIAAVWGVVVVEMQTAEERGDAAG